MVMPPEPPPISVQSWLVRAPVMNKPSFVSFLKKGYWCEYNPRPQNRSFSPGKVNEGKIALGVSTASS